MRRGRSRFYLALGIFFLLFVAAVVFILLPLHSTIEERSEALYQARIDALAAEEEQRNVQVSLREYERLTASVDTIEAFFVPKSEVIAFISSLEDAATINGVVQQIENLTAPTDEAPQSTFSLTVEGPFPNLAQYLDDLESLPYYLTLDKLAFVRAETAEGGPNVRLSFQAILEWQ